jgi:hypothetical protein
MISVISVPLMRYLLRPPIAEPYIYLRDRKNMVAPDLGAK